MRSEDPSKLSCLRVTVVVVLQISNSQPDVRRADNETVAFDSTFTLMPLWALKQTLPQGYTR